jgi:hypothetical protein
MKRHFLFATLCFLSLNSFSASSEDGLQTVSGVLDYFPPEVQSQQAWYGHNFMIGNTPLQPTADFPAKKLRTYIGKRIKISGVWNKGTLFNPNEPQQISAMPLSENDAPVMRNDGINVQVLELISPP